MRDGKVRAVVVTAVKPSPVAAYAVEELVTTSRKRRGSNCRWPWKPLSPQGTTAGFLWA